MRKRRRRRRRKGGSELLGFQRLRHASSRIREIAMGEEVKKNRIG